MTDFHIGWRSLHGKQFSSHDPEMLTIHHRALFMFLSRLQNTCLTAICNFLENLLVNDNTFSHEVIRRINACRVVYLAHKFWTSAQSATSPTRTHCPGETVQELQTLSEMVITPDARVPRRGMAAWILPAHRTPVRDLGSCNCTCPRGFGFFAW
jgi:hypothetical protein